MPNSFSHHLDSFHDWQTWADEPVPAARGSVKNVQSLMVDAFWVLCLQFKPAGSGVYERMQHGSIVIVRWKTL